MSKSNLPFDPYDLFKYDLDTEKVQIANLILTMQNNVLLKILVQKATEDDYAGDMFREYESKLAELWANLYVQLDINNDKDLEIDI